MICLQLNSIQDNLLIAEFSTEWNDSSSIQTNLCQLFFHGRSGKEEDNMGSALVYFLYSSYVTFPAR